MKSHELKERIVQTINEVSLPIDATYFVLKEVLNTVSNIYNEELSNQKKEQEKEQEDCSFFNEKESGK